MTMNTSPLWNEHVDAKGFTLLELLIGIPLS
jgi:type II secretory pathway component PulJ